MKLTKYEHACLVLEKGGTTLVIDPGSYSHDFIAPKHVDGIIITHEHADHLDEMKVATLLKQNPKATIIAHESITSRYPDSPTLVTTIGEPHTLGAFSLRFFGGTHAAIDESVSVPPNIGVLIDESLYYPGDSFTVPALPEGVRLETLALPVSAPWLKFDMTAKYLGEVQPKFAFPTHDAILSADGRQLADRMVGGVASRHGIVYKRLDGVSIEL